MTNIPDPERSDNTIRAAHAARAACAARRHASLAVRIAALAFQAERAGWDVAAWRTIRTIAWELAISSAQRAERSELDAEPEPWHAPGGILVQRRRSRP